MLRLRLSATGSLFSRYNCVLPKLYNIMILSVRISFKYGLADVLPLRCYAVEKIYI